MRLEVTPLKVEFLANKTAKRFSTWISYTYSVNDYEFDSFTPLPSLITLTLAFCLARIQL
jgi:hypothetical protein